MRTRPAHAPIDEVRARADTRRRVRVPPGASVDVSAERPFGRLRAPIRRLAVAALGLLDEGACELSIALVGDEEIRRLNASYRGKDATTDVLAFSQREGPDMAASGALLGDVVISIPTAERQAHARRTPLERELAELLVHGILHLLGFDHERSRADARRMFARQREIVAGLERRGWRHPSGSRKLVDRGDETRTRPRGMPSR